MKQAIFFAVLLGAFVLFSCGEEDPPIVNDDVSVYVYPDSLSKVYYEDTIQFRVSVFNTTDTTVDWYVEDILEGNDSLGTISSNGLYIAPEIALYFDHIIVKAVSHADSTKSDSTEVLILDQYQVYVDSADGNDLSGTGSYVHKFRTISRALATAVAGQTVLVGLGTYNEAGDETFPLTPTENVTVQGRGIDSTFVEPPATAAAFKLDDNHAIIKYLTIRGSGQTGIGVEFAGDATAKTLTATEIAIDNFRTAAHNTGEADSIIFIHNEISDCVYGMVINQPVDMLDLDLSVFTDIDSIAIQLTSPAAIFDCNFVTIDGALIGLNLAQDIVTAVITHSEFANIDSVAVLLFASADMGNQFQTGNNDFSGCPNLCVYNATPDSIYAMGNIWPASDSATIDTVYIYDDDDDESLGAVKFMPFQ